MNKYHLVKKSNDEDTNFKVGDYIGLSKYKTFLLKDIFQIGLKVL